MNKQNDKREHHSQKHFYQQFLPWLWCFFLLLTLGCAQQSATREEAGKVEAGKQEAEKQEPAPMQPAAANQANSNDRMLEEGVVRAGRVFAPELASERAQPSPVASVMMDNSAPGISQSYVMRGITVAEQNRENYRHRDENSLKLVAESPVSTFSIDVDTASYANARRMLGAGSLPNPDAVRAEEFINYFDYQYPLPDNRDQPFSVYTEIAPSPWAEGKYLLHVGLRGYDTPLEQLPASNLVFLVDVSGSMAQPNKLPLLKTSLKLLSRQLSAKDSVSIVVYAGAAGVVLEPTAGDNQRAIHAALERLEAGGSTNGGAGIALAYSLAEQAFIKDGINRVILATDGDFNVGVSNIEALKKLVENKRNTGISLTTLGFGAGNYNDALMNELAEIGNGNSAYIDTALEARKVLVDEISSTLFTIASDVKIQIEFSPLVQEYRLIGYESRMLNREDFNNDAKDAGEIGAGHSVTALYEIVLAGSEAAMVDPLRYQTQPKQGADGRATNELAFLKLRYKLPGETSSKLIEQPILRNKIQDNIARSSNDFRFGAAAAAFAQLLRGGDYVSGYDYDQVLALANGAKGDDSSGYRNEFINLVRMAQTLQLASTPGSQPLAQQRD